MQEWNHAGTRLVPASVVQPIEMDRQRHCSGQPGDHWSLPSIVVHNFCALLFILCWEFNVWRLGEPQQNTIIHIVIQGYWMLFKPIVKRFFSSFNSANRNSKKNKYVTHKTLSVFFDSVIKASGINDRVLNPIHLNRFCACCFYRVVCIQRSESYVESWVLQKL